MPEDKKAPSDAESAPKEEKPKPADKVVIKDKLDSEDVPQLNQLVEEKVQNESEQHSEDSVKSESI